HSSLLPFPTRRSSDLVVAPLSFPFFLDELDSRDQYTTFAETGVLSPRMVNDFRLAFNRMVPTDDSYATIPIDHSVDFVPGQGPRSEEHTSELQSRVDL